MPWFLLTLLLWSSMEAVSKPLMGVFDPFSLTLFRFVCGIAVLAVFAAAGSESVRLKRLGIRNLLILCLMGFLNTFLSMSLLQLAILRSTPASAASIFCTNPLLVLLLSILAGWEKFSPLRTLSFLVGIAGVTLITAATPPDDVMGVVFALLAALAFAVYTMMGKRICSDVGPVTANLVSFCAGAVSLALFMLVTGRELLPEGQWFRETGNILRLAHLGFLVSGIGYLAFFKALRRMKASAISLIFFLKPALATGFSMLLADEHPNALFLCGVTLVVLSSAVNFRASFRSVLTSGPNS